MLYDEKWNKTQFLSAEALGLSYGEKERAAMIKVLSMMENGTILEDQFDMGNTWISCGSVGCIGGWVGYVMNSVVDVSRYVANYQFSRNNSALADLYWNDWAVNGNSNVTVAQGATALRNFLTTGHAQWDKVLAA